MYLSLNKYCNVVDFPTCLGPVIKTTLKPFAAFLIVCSIVLFIYIFKTPIRNVIQFHFTLKTQIKQENHLKSPFILEINGIQFHITLKNNLILHANLYNKLMDYMKAD